MNESRLSRPLPLPAPTNPGASAADRDGSSVAPLCSPAGGAPADVAATLGLSGEANRRARIARHLRRWGIPAIVLLGSALAFWLRRAPATPTYEMIAARRGDLTVAVTATGTLAPLETVYVGTEVSGRVEVVAADYNDRVEKGQVLAVLDTDQLAAQVRQARAALQAAEASTQQAAATFAEVAPQAARAESLFARNLVSPQDVESARAALARARAADANARAQVAGAKAALQTHETALRKATIRAPISGLVLRRDVERGRRVFRGGGQGRRGP